MTETQTHTTYNNPWNAFEDTPEAADIKQLKARTLVALHRHIRANGWNQTQAAHAFGVKQPRISNLMTGKIDKFTLDSLLEMAVRAGLPVRVEVDVPAAEPAPEPVPLKSASPLGRRVRVPVDRPNAAKIARKSGSVRTYKVVAGSKKMSPKSAGKTVTERVK
jgi:predicted XRE-type DNA-binding protein